MRNELCHINNFNTKLLFYSMFLQKMTIKRIQDGSVKITFSTLLTNFRLYILDNIKTALQPMLFFDPLFPRLAAAKFTDHDSSAKAYTVMITRLASSLNRQIT